MQTYGEHIFQSQQSNSDIDSLIDNNSDEFDYIIVGAGSAGCVLANRLSADASKTVLLIEAGGKDTNPWLHVPVGYFKTMHNPKHDWCYLTEPDEGINQRQLQWPRGRVLGGSSSLNGLLYVRGQAEDYDDWAALGNVGWSYKEVLPYFKKSEDQSRGADDYHGVGGPLKVSDLRLRRKIATSFIDGAKEIGIPWNSDYNGESQEGVSYFQQTAYKGFRWSTAKGFLKPIRKRSNLIILTHHQVTKVLIHNGRAMGVSCVPQGSKAQPSIKNQPIDAKELKTYRAKSSVILSGGAINSPQLLMLSGIGPKDELSKHQIPAVKILEGVGQNLQDHLQARLVYKTKLPTLNNEVNTLWGKIKVGLQYALFRQGPLTLAASQVTIFTRSNPEIERPDIQFHMQPLSADKPGDGAHKFSAFTMSVCQLRPESKGSIRLVSNHPLDYPKIYPNYLSADTDQAVIRDGLKVARAIAKSDSMKEQILEEMVPGSAYQTDEELLLAARSCSQTIYHPTSTCKMGPMTDEMAVVDERLRVYGIAGLRVVDASVMPNIVSGNTNAPTIMIAEKAADMIIADEAV